MIWVSSQPQLSGTDDGIGQCSRPPYPLILLIVGASSNRVSQTKFRSLALHTMDILMWIMLDQMQTFSVQCTLKTNDLIMTTYMLCKIQPNDYFDKKISYMEEKILAMMIIIELNKTQNKRTHNYKKKKNKYVRLKVANEERPTQVPSMYVKDMR